MGGLAKLHAEKGSQKPGLYGYFFMKCSDEKNPLIKPITNGWLGVRVEGKRLTVFYMLDL